MEHKVPCSQRIKEGLLVRGMKQADLCQITGIGKSAMSQYINGAFEPKQNRIYQIAKALNVSEAWLMGFDVPMEREKIATKNGGDLTDKQRKYLEQIENLSEEQLKMLDIFMSGLAKSDQ